MVNFLKDKWKSKLVFFLLVLWLLVRFDSKEGVDIYFPDITSALITLVVFNYKSILKFIIQFPWNFVKTIKFIVQ